MQAEAALRIVLHVAETDEIRRLKEENRRLSNIHLWRAYHFQVTMQRFAQKKLWYVNSRISLPPLKRQTLINIRYDDDNLLFVEPNLTNESYILQESSSDSTYLSDIDALAEFAETHPLQFEYYLNFRVRWIDLDTPSTGIVFMSNE